MSITNEQLIATSKDIVEVVAGITTETGAAIIARITSMMENLEGIVPPETAPVVAVFKSAVRASQKAIETAQGTAKMAVELAESNLAAIPKKSTKGASTHAE